MCICVYHVALAIHVYILQESAISRHISFLYYKVVYFVGLHGPCIACLVYILIHT